MKKKSKGRIAEDGATHTKPRPVTLDDATVKKAKRIGDGNLSLGIRIAVRAAP